MELKNETTGIQTKECATTHTATPLPITTRQAGFGTIQFLSSVNLTPRAEQLYALERGLPLQYYRVTLALIETKLHLTLRHLHIGFKDAANVRRFEISPRRINMCTGTVIMPEPIATMVNAIGILKEGECTYMNVLPPDYFSRGGQFVPLAENITISNLRATVESLANPETNVDIRLNFRNHNPIPCTIWDARNILQNPDDVIPENYGDNELAADMTAIIAHRDYMTQKYPKYIRQYQQKRKTRNYYNESFS